MSVHGVLLGPARWLPGSYGKEASRTACMAGVALAALLWVVTDARAAAPAPCGPGVQVTDAVGDGHHANADVTAAWFAEDRSSGAVTAVVQLSYAVWEPVHDDSDSVGVAMLYRVGQATRYLRMQAPRPPAAIEYDHGTWTPAGGFERVGEATGSVLAGSKGTVSMTVPAAAGAVTGTKLGSPFVLTWDGVAGGVPHWVDRAPGGVSPDDGPERGADFLVGTCAGPPSPKVNALSLAAPARSVGGGPVVVSGRVFPAREGVRVTLSGTGTSGKTLITGPGGAFSTPVPVARTTRLKVEAEGVSSRTVTIELIPVVSIVVKRTGPSAFRVEGTVRPGLPGRVLLLKSNAYRPTAVTSAVGGRFGFRLRNPQRGIYEAVYIPSGGIAARATSNRGAIR